jgi:hypothetical protein
MAAVNFHLAHASIAVITEQLVQGVWYLSEDILYVYEICKIYCSHVNNHLKIQG